MRETLEETPTIKNLVRKFRTAGQIEKALNELKEIANHAHQSPVEWLINHHENYESGNLREQMQSLYPSDRNGVELTPEQQEILLGAIIERTENPQELVSEKTMGEAINFGCVELIPLLHEIGAEIKDKHFTQAGSPIHCPEMAEKLLETLIPYVKDVNVTDDYRRNAGHILAQEGNLTAFNRLEEKGLEKDAIALTSLPTYAHEAAICVDQEKARLFIEHLAKNGYELNVSYTELIGKNSEWKGTPIEVAAETSHLETVLTFIDNDVPMTPKVMECVIENIKHNKLTQEKVVDFLDDLAERNVLDTECIIAAAGEINQTITKIPSFNMDYISDAVMEYAEELGCVDQLHTLQKCDLERVCE
jgi:hypothetical protein